MPRREIARVGCVLCPVTKKTMKAEAKVESHVENFDLYLHFKVWMVCLGQRMPEMSTFEIFFSIFSPGLIHVYEEEYIFTSTYVAKN